MTIGKLHKQLSKLIEKGHARKSVVINKTTFIHALESNGCCILDVTRAKLELFYILNDDGGLSHGNDGHEKFKLALVLTGK